MNTAKSLISGKALCTMTVSGLQAKDINAAHEGLFRFDREVPPELQRRWHLNVPRDPEYKEPDDGVIRKDGTDKKLYLHYRPGLLDHLDEAGVSTLIWQLDWLEACDRIWRACASAMMQLADAMDELKPGYGFADRVNARGDDQHCLRILKYFPRAGSLAQTHFDRCAITQRIAESHPGFYVQDGWNKLFWSGPKTPRVDCFAGDQLERASKGGIRRVWHGAEDQTDGTSERWAIVFFGKMVSGSL